MIHSVGIDFHRDQHRARCLDDRAQPCDSFSFQTTPEGLAKLEERIFRDGTINRSPGDSVLVVQAKLARHNSPRTTLEPRLCVLDNTLCQVC